MMTNYSEHFTINELQCPTSLIIKLEDGFIDALEKLRKEYGRPMVVTSGCRSDEHNKKLKQDNQPAAKHSFNLMGNKGYLIDTIAVDVAKPNIYDQARLVSIALYNGWTVRVGSSFIHLDQRSRYTDLYQHFDTY